jgi:drug/metabolite transporter (DMT)-like permease
MLQVSIAIVLWSSLGLLIRFSGTPAHLLIFFSSIISSFIAGAALLQKKYRKEMPSFSSLAYLMILGPITLANTFSFYYAYQNTSIANAVLAHYIAPLMVALLAPVFLKEKLTARVLAAVAVATAGLWTMFGISAPQFLALLTAGDRNTAGIFAGLFSGLCYAALIIVLRKSARNYHPLVMTFFQNSVIIFLLLPFAALPDSSGPGLWVPVVMGVVHSTIAPLLYFRGIQHVSANQAAILGYIEPVCAILLGAVFLGETVQPRVILGGALILFSGYVTVRM